MSSTWRSFGRTTSWRWGLGVSSSPGTVVSIGNFVLNGKSYGNTLEIQPSQEASSVVVITRLRADPSLTVGEPVLTGRSKIGSVIDLSGVEKQTLASVTHDAGNHVTIEVVPAPTTPIR